MDALYNILKHAHAGLRWVVLILLITVIIQAFAGWKTNKPYTGMIKTMAKLTVIFTHVQFLIGLHLYFAGPKGIDMATEGFMANSVFRFFAMEHVVMMLIAIALITIGNAKAKREAHDMDKQKKLFVFFTIALLVMIIAIPWPFREALGGSWF